MPMTQAEYIAYLKATATHKPLQEAEVLVQPEGDANSESEPIFIMAIAPMQPLWSAEDLARFEALAEGGSWQDKN